MADDPAQREWWARHQRISASPGAVIALMRMNADIDVRHVLPAIRIPTLVLHRRDERLIDISQGRFLAERIPGARFVELPGIDHLPWLGDVHGITGAVEEFLTGTSHIPEVDSVLVTVMVTAFVSPRQRGDACRRRRLESQGALVRRELARYRGREIRTAGDAFMATFDGPARAVRCARAIRDAARSLGLEARTGVHTGEVELRGDGVAGLAVDIGARVAALADPGEVLVSGTVTDLVAGSGLQFAERGTCRLEGVPGQWRLFVAQAEDGRL
ncbi:MAG: adenylate/guanylate cyclase domain-containing protein [Chloroflexota bacterium]|nr:adenylate/guanylate cyclase domain-containing protein [Chloroflexota bacterium]